MKLGPARQHFTSNSLICYATTLKGHYCDITPLKIPTISCFFPHPYVQAYKSPFFPKNVLTHPTTVLNWLPLPWVWTADPLPGLEPMFAKYIHSLSQLTINTPHWTAAPGPATLKWPVATTAPYRYLPAPALWPFTIFSLQNPTSSYLLELTRDPGWKQMLASIQGPFP